MKFYEKIRLLRKEKGKTQYAVHKDIGIGVETIRKYERSSPETFPNSAQLILLKNYYNVTYEYLLDENCLNKHPASIDIGKKLKLSDKSIQQIVNLQTNKSFDDDVQPDKESPASFDKWLSNFNRLSLFASYLTDYYLLNDLLECSKYFSGILELAPYIVDCLNADKNNLISIFNLLEANLSIYEKCVIHNETSSKLDNNSFEELNSYFTKLKNYCNSYKPTSNKNSLNRKKVKIDDELFKILNEITEIGAESYQFTYNDLQFCEFKIIELIRDNLHDISKSNEELELPDEYTTVIKSLRKAGKIK